MVSTNKTVCADSNLIFRYEELCILDKETPRWSDCFKLGIVEKTREKEEGTSLRMSVEQAREKLSSMTSLYRDLLRKYESKTLHYENVLQINDELRKKLEQVQK